MVRCCPGHFGGLGRETFIIPDFLNALIGVAPGGRCGRHGQSATDGSVICVGKVHGLQTSRSRSAGRHCCQSLCEAGGIHTQLRLLSVGGGDANFSQSCGPGKELWRVLNKVSGISKSLIHFVSVTFICTDGDTVFVFIVFLLQNCSCVVFHSYILISQ